MFKLSSASGLKKAQVVDVHAHVVLESTIGAAGRYGPEVGSGQDGRPWFRIGDYYLRGVRYQGGPFMDVQARLQRMDDSGIDFQILSPNPLTYFHHIDLPEAVAFCRRHNDALAALVDRHPDRLAGLAALPMQDPEAAATELHRAVVGLGLAGAAVGTDIRGRALHSTDFDALYATFVALNVPLFIHPGPAGIDGPPGDPNLKAFDLDIIAGFAAQETTAVAGLFFGGVLERHPRLDICVSHGGGTIALLAGRVAQAGLLRPWAPEWARRDGAFVEFLQKLWFDTHLPDERSLQVLKELVGTSRLVFGTNFAGWDQPSHAEITAHAGAYTANAQRLFRTLVSTASGSEVAHV